jgi:Tol biopolymer transport system component
MSAAIALRMPGLERAPHRVWLGRLALVAILASLVLLAAATLLVGGPRPPAPPVRYGNGVIAYATGSGLSPVYLVRPGEQPRKVIPGESTVGNDVVCPAFSPDGAMLAVGMPGGSVVVLSIDESGELGDGRRLASRAGESPHCPAWAPDSSAIAFLDVPFPLGEAARGGATLEIDPLVGEPRRIAGWEPDAGVDGPSFSTDYAPDRAVQWSPDGSTIALARPSGIWLVPVDGLEPHRILESPARTVSWSPDGTRMVTWTPRGTLVIDAGSGNVVATLPGGEQPVWSPTHDLIAYRDRQSSSVMVVKPDGADSRVVSDYGYNVTWSPDGKQIMYIRDGCAGSPCPYAHGYALMAQAIDADGNPQGEAVIVVPMVAVDGERSYPPAQSFSWQPVPQVGP